VSTPNEGMFGHGQVVDYNNRRKRGKDKKTLILEALMAEVKEEGTGDELTAEQAEAAYLRALVKRSMNVADKASAVLAKEVLVRLMPVDKATMPVYKIEFPEDGSASAKIEAIVAAVACGDVPPDVGNMMVNMVTAAIKVEETVELMERLSRLEEMLAELDRE